MANQVIANASQLILFDDSLKQTVSQIDSVLFDNENQVLMAKQKIATVQAQWDIIRRSAFNELMVAQEALSQAESRSEEGNAPSSYYQAVSICQSRYDEVSRICTTISYINDDFLMRTTGHKSKLSELRQHYITVLQKSSHILNQYAELVRRSVAITSGPSSVSQANLNLIETDSNSIAQVISANQAKELNHTLQTWEKENDGSMIFNTPQETGQTLDSCQGKDPAFQGTCGLVSCVNVLRLAGYPATERMLVNYASTTSAGFARGKLCITNSFPDDNGGTSALDRQKILAHFGLKNELVEANVANISKAVSEGRGVIISVYAGMLYNGWTNHRDLHAITVTSVKLDNLGNVCGFYVCDSGTGGPDNAKYYTAQEISNALSGRPMNVTQIIR